MDSGHKIQNNEVTAEQAATWVRLMIEEGADLSDFSKRTPMERIALGVVFLNKRTSGQTERTIAASYNLSQSTVHRYINLALDTYPPINVANDRLKMIEMLDRQIEVWQVKSEEGDEKAAAVVARFYDQRAKVAGTYAPIEVSQTVVEITKEERELQEMIAEQERLAAAKTSELNSTVEQ